MILGYTIDRAGTDIVVPICLVGALAAAAAVLTFPRPAASVVKEAAAEKPASLPEFVRKNGRFMCVVLCLVLVYLSHVFINSFTIQIVMSRGGSGSEMGLASAIGGFLELPAMALFPVLLKKLGRDMPAIGFGVKLDYLLETAEKPVFSPWKLYYPENRQAEAMVKARELRKEAPVEMIPWQKDTMEVVK
jgi:hypothetical protein